MIPNVDIFRIESERDVRWLQVAASLEGAIARAQELARRDHDGFLIVDQNTGNRLVVGTTGILSTAESNGSNPWPGWRELYKATVLETDLTALQRLLLATEHTIFLRLQALAEISDAEAEQQEITEASGALLALKSERLGWPNWKSDSIADGSGW
jgi:hypothetical protein